MFLSEFGWTRLAYLTVTLTVLALLVKLGTFGASSISQNFPESVFAFSQTEVPVEEQYRDEEEDHGEDERAEEHAEEHASHDHSHEGVASLYENVNFAEDAPVFYRPAPQVESASRNPSSGGRTCQTVGDAPPGSKIIFPVTRDHFDSYEDTWGAARPQGGHEGTDLMVPNGTPLLAMTDGRIVPVSGASANGWNTLGGYTVMLEAAYSVGPVKKGDLFYYAHLDRRSDLRIGDTVKAGDVVGFAGDTGQGPEGARGQFPPHLHLGRYETSGERTQLASGAMNPYPLLEWVKANGGSIEGGSDIPYCEAPQSSAPIPSGGGYWLFPSDPGVRPDMATGGGTAAPSPVVEQNDSSEFSPDVTREPRRSADPPRPENPPRSENPDPPERNNPPREPTNPAPPRNGTTPNLPNPLPGIGDGIRDIIEDVLRPNPPNSPDDTPDPATPPRENTAPEDATGEETVPENPASEETTPEAKNPEDTMGNEADECEPREHGGAEKGRDSEFREHDGDDEECSEDTHAGEEPPLDEDTSGDEATDDEELTEETTSSGVIENQYDESQYDDEPGGGSPETTSGP